VWQHNVLQFGDGLHASQIDVRPGIVMLEQNVSPLHKRSNALKMCKKLFNVATNPSQFVEVLLGMMVT
jgi:hypothetical protein